MLRIREHAWLVELADVFTRDRAASCAFAPTGVAVALVADPHTRTSVNPEESPAVEPKQNHLVKARRFPQRSVIREVSTKAGVFSASALPTNGCRLSSTVMNKCAEIIHRWALCLLDCSVLIYYGVTTWLESERDGRQRHPRDHCCFLVISAERCNSKQKSWRRFLDTDRCDLPSDTRSSSACRNKEFSHFDVAEKIPSCAHHTPPRPHLKQPAS